jgi:hypothetical protein
VSVHYEKHAGAIEGGFFGEMTPDGSCSGVNWSPDAGHALHVLDGAGYVFVGVSGRGGKIMGCVMTPEQTERHIDDLRRMVAYARGARGAG